MDNVRFLLLCVILAGLLVLVLGMIVLLRYIRYRETLKLAEQGLIRPEQRDGRDALRWGIGLSALGLALGIGLYPLGSLFPGEYPLNFGPWMLLGLLPLFFGLGLILIHILTRKT